MNKTIRFLILALILALLPASAFAQAALTQTIISAAITTTNASTMTVAAAGTLTASTNLLTYYAYLDHELVKILSVTGTTIGIARGQEGTVATTHAANTPLLYYVGTQPGTTAAFRNRDRSGSCTRANELVLPQINTTNGNIWDCPVTSGKWQSSNFTGALPLLPYASISTTTYTASLADYYIEFVSHVNTAGATTQRTLTLPAITGIYGKVYVIADHGNVNPGGCAATGCILIVASAGQTFGTAATGTSTNLQMLDATRAQTITVISNGTGWFTIAPHAQASNNPNGFTLP